MRTYLSVPFSEKEEAKNLGAKWDYQEKMWYAPKSEEALLLRWPLNNHPIHELVGEDRHYGGNQLFVDLVPSSCWFTNVRKCIDFSDWDRLRKFVYTRSNNRCECCSATGRLDAHERWYFDNNKKVQKLMRIIALCELCHEATHMGLAQVRGRGDIAKNHLMQVTGMSLPAAQKHIQAAFTLWDKRNKDFWDLDLSIITESGIKLQNEFDKIARANIAKEMLNDRKIDDLYEETGPDNVNPSTIPYQQITAKKQSFLGKMRTLFGKFFWNGGQ